MPALDALPRHSALGRAITGTAALIVGTGLFIGVYPYPSPRIQMTTILAMTGLVAAALWLRRRDRRVYEARRLETAPDGLRRALDDVEAASREATDGLRRMLAVLRDERTPPTPGAVTASSPPAGAGAGPGLAGSLAEAIDGARRAGVRVELDADAVTGAGAGADAAPGAAAPGGPTAAVNRVAVRVVGEALVNTARHAGPTRARVTLLEEPGRLRVRVVDDGPAPGWAPRPGAGQGLRGLGERVTALGGSLTAGPRGDAPGFAVEAVLPRVPGPRASEPTAGRSRD